MRPIRPKPLMPTRTVTRLLLPGSPCTAVRVRPQSSVRAERTQRAVPATRGYRRTGPQSADWLRLATSAQSAEHLRGHRRLGVGDAEVARPACRPSPAAGGSGRRPRPWSSAGRRARRAPPASLLVLQPQPAGLQQVLGGVVGRGSPAPARPGHRRPPRPGPTGAGWRRRSWPAGWRWPAPRGASAAPPRPARTRARRCRVSRAPIASPSRTTTRSTPRTSRALAEMPSRRPTPTSASAASADGAGDLQRATPRPGSVSEPWARNAPRQAASASPIAAGDDVLAAARAPAGRAGRPGRSGGPAPRRPW